MKRGTIAGIAAAVAAIIALGALALYLTLQYKEDMFFSAPDAAEANAEVLIRTLFETEAAEPSKKAAFHTTDGEAPADDLPIIWVGDSRTIGMRDAVDNDDLYIGASGEGYNWLYETGLPQLRNTMKHYPEAPVVFNFGVNDYDNINNYVALYERLKEEYPDTHFYFLSVNPIDPAVCKNITNEDISDFNAHLRKAFSSAYIDSFTFLMANEAITIDGIHYSEDDYREIHSFASSHIKKTESSNS